MAAIIKCCARAHFTGRNKCCDNCECPEKRESVNEYMRDYRKKKRELAQGLGKLHAVPDIPASIPAPPPTTVKTQYPPGIIGQNALAEIAKIDGATERNPLIVALIMQIASEIDRGEVAQLASAANTIQRMMGELRAQARPAAGESGPAAETPMSQFLDAFRAAGSA